MGKWINHFTIEELNRLFRLDAKTGILYWKQNRPNNPNLIDTIAGNRELKRWVVTYDGKCLTRSRVVYAIHHGHWPEHALYHLNRNLTDDRPDNLVCKIEFREKLQSEIIRKRINKRANRNARAGIHRLAVKEEMIRKMIEKMKQKPRRVIVGAKPVHKAPARPQQTTKTIKPTEIGEKPIAAPKASQKPMAQAIITDQPRWDVITDQPRWAISATNYTMYQQMTPMEHFQIIIGELRDFTDRRVGMMFRDKYRNIKKRFNNGENETSIPNGNTQDGGTDGQGD